MKCSCCRQRLESLDYYPRQVTILKHMPASAYVVHRGSFPVTRLGVIDLSVDKVPVNCFASGSANLLSLY